MKNNKPRFLNIPIFLITLIVWLCFVVSFASCRLSVSQKGEQLPEENLVVTVEVSSFNDFSQLVSVEELNDKSRSAIPSELKDTSNLTLAFAASLHAENDTAGKIECTFDESTGKITFAFTSSSSVRNNYVLEVFAYKNGTSNFESSTPLLHGLITGITIAANAFSLNAGTVQLLPYESSTAAGKVNLSITVPSSYTLSCSDSNFVCSGSGGAFNFSEAGTSGIAPGTYNVTFTLLKDASDLKSIVYAWSEKIYVYPGMITNKWNTGTVDTVGARVISDKQIFSTFYVRGASEDTWYQNIAATGFTASSGDDINGDGSIAKPYASVQKAVDRIVGTGSSAGINDGSTPYTIFVDGLITASSDGTVVNFSSASSGAVKISIIGVDSANKATFKGNYSAVESKDSVIDIPESSSLNLTLDNLIITEGAASNGGGINIGSGTVTIKDCEISGNRVINYGGAIYNKGTLNFAGAVKVDEDNDVYLFSDGAGGVKFITITSALTASGTVARITLPPENYKAGTQVLAVAGITMTNSICQKFKLNKFDDTTAESTAFFIVTEGTTKGILKSNQSSATNPVELQGAYTLTVKKNSSNLSAGTVLSTGDVLSFTVTDRKGNAPSASNYKIAVRQHGEEITSLTKSVANLSDAKITIPRTLAETGDTIDVFVSATINGVMYDNTVRGMKLVLTP